MELTPMTFLIICPLLFLAGMVDAIGGGLIMTNGAKIVKPSILFVLVLLAIKLFS